MMVFTYRMLPDSASIAYELLYGEAIVRTSGASCTLFLGTELSVVGIPLATKYSWAGEPHAVVRVDECSWDVLNVELSDGWRGTVRLNGVPDPPPWPES